MFERWKAHEVCDQHVVANRSRFREIFYQLRREQLVSSEIRVDLCDRAGHEHQDVVAVGRSVTREDLGRLIEVRCGRKRDRAEIILGAETLCAELTDAERRMTALRVADSYPLLASLRDLRARRSDAVNHVARLRGELQVLVKPARPQAFVVGRDDQISSARERIHHRGVLVEEQIRPLRRGAVFAFMAGLARIRPLERRYFARARQLSARTPPSDYAYSLFLESYLRAGEGAWSRAEALSSAGLRLLDPQEGLILRDATAILGFVARTRGDYVSARKHASTLRRSAREAGNREHEIWSEVLEGSCWVRALAYERAREHLERARVLLEEAPEWVCQLRSFAQLAHVHFGMERTPQAVALAASGLNVLRQHQGPPLLVSSTDAVMSLAHVHIELWREHASDAAKQALARESLRYLARLALVFPVARAYYLLCLGRYQVVLGRTRRAAVLFTLAERSARSLGLPYEQALVDWHRAQLQAVSGAQREQWIERARQHFAQLGSNLSMLTRAPG